MATNVIMPSLGFDMAEGKLARWLKNEGDQVEKGQAIAEIETEKATVEIEAAMAGTLQKITVPAGETVPVGTVIALIAEPGEKDTGTASPAAAPESAVVTARPVQAPAQARQAVAPVAEPRRAEGPEDTRIKASPLARRMARDAGIDLAQLEGSGPGGRIMERDIEAAVAGRAPAAPAQRPPAAAPRPEPRPAAPAPAPAAPQPGEVAALNRMRQAIARRMTESKTTVPHFYVTVQVNMTEALKLREQVNALASEEEKLSVNDLIIAAAARTLLQFSTLNAYYRDGSLEMHPEVNVGIAVALEDGLITPVIRDADKKSLKQIAVESKGAGERARSGKLRADDLGGATFTVSNLGMFGIDEFIAIINPPEAAILAVGAAAKQPIVDGDEVRIAPLMKATLSVDHRVADGAQAARFLQAFQKMLENPVNLLLSD